MFMFEPGYVEEIDPNKKPKTDADAPVLYTPTPNPQNPKTPKPLLLEKSLNTKK